MRVTAAGAFGRPTEAAMASAKIATDRAKGLAAIAFFGVVAIAGATLTRAWESALGVARPADSGQGSFDGPISFEPNKGQADENVKFVARGPGYVVYVTEKGTLLSLGPEVEHADAANRGSLAINFVGTVTHLQPVALRPVPASSSYLSGRDQTKWITGIPNFAQVQFHDVYSGIDVICHGTHGSLGYDFKVEPGADASVIALEIQGARRVQLTPGGELSIRTTRAELRLKRPFAYQEIGGSKHTIAVRYVVNNRRVRFVLGDYDPRKALTIDPVLSYVKYLR